MNEVLIRKRIRNKMQTLALEYSRERRSENAKKQARAANGRFGSGGGKSSTQKKNKGVTGEIKKKNTKKSKSSSDEESSHTKKIAGGLAAELAIGHVIDKLKHNKQFKAGIIQGKRALLRARSANLKGVLKGAGAAAGRTLKQPVKETAKVAVKKSFNILMKTGKFSARHAMKIAPFLLKSAAAIGVVIANIPNVPLWGVLAASAVAYASYRVYKYVRNRHNEKKEKEKLKKVIDSINEDRFWQQYETYRKKNRLTGLQHT